MNARFHSSQQKASRFFAETVTGKEEGSDSSDVAWTIANFIFLFIIFEITSYYVVLLLVKNHQSEIGGMIIISTHIVVFDARNYTNDGWFSSTTS